jgi:hypothetical protein
MSDTPTADVVKSQRLIARLSKSPLEYRLSLAVLDPDWVGWPPEGRPEHELHFIGETPVLIVKPWGVCFVPRDPTDDEAAQVAAFLPLIEFGELYAVGEAAMHALRRHITDGRWQISRQYSLGKADFVARPSDCVRKLGPSDRNHVEKAVETYRVAKHCATIRDFNYMAQGQPVTCHGAFMDGGLAAFCSSNPVYTGITEISWIFTAEPYRRRSLAAGLLTVAAEEAFARGDVVSYFNGEATEGVYAMVTGIGFREVRPIYRFIPASCPEQWRCWGKDV